MRIHLFQTFHVIAPRWDIQSNAICKIHAQCKAPLKDFTQSHREVGYSPIKCAEIHVQNQRSHQESTRFFRWIIFSWDILDNLLKHSKDSSDFFLNSSCRLDTASIQKSQKSCSKWSQTRKKTIRSFSVVHSNFPACEHAVQSCPHHNVTTSDSK